jgi:hypothetical protein
VKIFGVFIPSASICATAFLTFGKKGFDVAMWVGRTRLKECAMSFAVDAVLKGL